MKSTTSITIGFSVNPEIAFGFTDGEGKKGTLDFLSVDLSGSSANVAKCLMNMGHNPLLIVPTEVGDSDEATLLERALRKSELLHVRLELLKRTSMAVYPIGDRRGSTSALYGQKGERSNDPEILHRALLKIVSFDGDWRFATAVNEDFLIPANYLLGEKPGFRVFGPNKMLCQNTRFQTFSLSESPMSRCDLLIFNRFEFETLDRTIEEIHEQGVSVVIVTNGARGGDFSLCNASTGGYVRVGSYEAVKTPIEAEIYLVGAGDWFLGGLASYLVDYVEDNEGKSLLDLPIDVLRKACNFGAKVASKKITMRGGSKGPTREDL